MENIERNTAAAAEDQEESLVLKFRRPYKFEGVEYGEVDLSGLEDMTAADLCAVERILKKKGIVDPLMEMSLPMACQLASRASGKPVEFFEQIPAREATRLKNLVTGFLYGGDGED
jgi:hypothetical protein